MLGTWRFLLGVYLVIVMQSFIKWCAQKMRHLQILLFPQFYYPSQQEKRWKMLYFMVDKVGKL